MPSVLIPHGVGGGEREGPSSLCSNPIIPESIDGGGGAMDGGDKITSFPSTQPSSEASSYHHVSSQKRKSKTLIGISAPPLAFSAMPGPAAAQDQVLECSEAVDIINSIEVGSGERNVSSSQPNLTSVPVTSEVGGGDLVGDNKDSAAPLTQNSLDASSSHQLESVGDSAINICNNRFWSNYEDSVAQKTWNIIQQLGVVGSEADEVYINRIHQMDLRDKLNSKTCKKDSSAFQR